MMSLCFTLKMLKKTNRQTEGVGGLEKQSHCLSLCLHIEPRSSVENNDPRCF